MEFSLLFVLLPVAGDVEHQVFTSGKRYYCMIRADEAPGIIVVSEKPA